MKQMKSFERQKRELSSKYEAQCSLKEEILELQKQLEDQIMIRYALEKALSCKNMSNDIADERIISKPAKDLLKEIAVLELEVKNLENHLLTLYRKVYGKKLSSLSIDEEEQLKKLSPKGRVNSEFVKPDDINSRQMNSEIVHSLHLPFQDSLINEDDDNILGGDGLISSLVHRSQSSLSHRSVRAFKSSPGLRQLEEAINSYQSLPLAMLERAKETTSKLSLAEHLRNKVHHSFHESPNEISEAMIKCISAVFFHLADPPLQNHEFNLSPISISSSVSLSPQIDQHDTWGLQSGENPYSKSWFHNRDVHPQDESSFFTLAEVHGIRRDDQSLHNVQHMLQKFRLLVLRLKEVEIWNLKHGQKLAFWINVHNALVMHALLVYGIPQKNVKRVSVVLKAAYNIGGYAISVDMIQSSILQCRLPRPGQWFQSFFFPRTKLKAEGHLKAYAIEHPEPRLYFALCSGSSSDPPVRMYTSNSVFEELEVAKEEYIQTNIRLHKEEKIMVPKVVDYFAKDLKLCPSGLTELLEHFLPSYQILRTQQSQRSKVWKKIAWSPHNFNFLFKLPNELVPS
ncbi:hypothetical protein Leryth_004339 [Lithospermum erythrorhizon]|uniref:Electron transporter n=1 Tax=Lithospermum erythrorhizon TaxID=34254 RepID=A0AAV3NQV2_LITER|nr:hypothetical protein Leryth_004339 [Lithospermum erythrorhizon]